MLYTESTVRLLFRTTGWGFRQPARAIVPIGGSLEYVPDEMILGVDSLLVRHNGPDRLGRRATMRSGYQNDLQYSSY